MKPNDEAPPAQESQTSGPVDFRALAKFVGAIIAPATLLAALAYYFGRRYTFERTAYFGIDLSLLDLSDQDYVLRSVDALFVPLAWLALATLVALQLHLLVKGRLQDRKARAALRLLERICLIIGGAVFLVGIYGLTHPLDPRLPAFFQPLSLGLGALVLGYGIYLRGTLRGQRATPRGGLGQLRGALVGLFVVLSLFWAAADYARAVGRQRAVETGANLKAQPAAAVFSKDRLGLRGPGLVEKRFPGTLYPYSYQGLRLIYRSGKTYFLVPERWSPSQGPAILLTESPALRFEFRPGRQ